MVTIKNVQYMHYGNCLEISNGDVVLRVTTDVGPRIIYYGNRDEDNMMFCDVDDNVNRSNEYLDSHFKKGEMWHIYGGHRLWKSPEDEASYFPDNYPVDVTLIDNGAIFAGAEECTTGIKKSIKITMNDDGVVTLDHSFYNYTDEPVSYALWALSVMNKGGLAVCPMSQEDTGLLANRNLVLWPYTNVRDERLNIQQDFISLQQQSICDGPLKIGMLNTEGVVYFIRDGKMLEKRFAPAKRDGNYADYCSNVEFYTSEHIIEVEILSEVKTILPKQTATHTEIWTLHVGDEQYRQITEWVNKR